MKVLNVRKLVMAAAAAAIAVGGAQTARAAELTLGSSSEDILNGGIIAVSDGTLYYANTEKNNYLYKGDKELSAEAAENINVVDGTVYYTSGNRIRTVSASGGAAQTEAQAASTIKEMYVDSSRDIYYLAGGSIYEIKAGTEESRAVDLDGSIKHFIPTAEGMIEAKGTTLNWTIFADDTQITSGVSTFYTYEDYLIFNQKSNDKQVKISDLFDGFTSSDITDYHLDSIAPDGVGNGSLDADVDAIAAKVADNAVVDDDYDLAAMNAETGEVSANQGGASSILNTSAVSEGQRNIVRRAYAQHNVSWTPKANITGWNGQYTFYAGTTYTGLPYGQPINNGSYHGSYVPWNTSLSGFVNAVNNAASLMYTSYANYNKRAPYYSCDCSSFVSWSWATKSRQNTGTIANYSNKVATQSIYGMQIGDALCKAGSHVVLVSDIGLANGQVAYIDIIEQTPPSTKLTRYGTGGSKTLADLAAKYFSKGYTLYRSKTRDSVSYDEANSNGSVTPTEVKPTVSITSSTVTITAGGSSSLKYSVSNAGSNSKKWTSSDSSVAQVDDSGKITGVSAGSAVITLSCGSSTDSVTVYVKPATPAVTSVTASGSRAFTVSWNAVAGADGYRLFVKAGSSRKWKSIAYTASTSYTVSGLVVGTSYRYTVRAYKDVAGKRLWSGYNKTGMSAMCRLETPVVTSVQSYKASRLTVKWRSVAGARGYLVYRKVNGRWKKIATVTKTYYVDKNLKNNARYIYAVRAYAYSGSRRILSGYMRNVSGYCSLQAPQLASASSAKTGTATLSWKKVSRAAGYVIYRKNGSSWVRCGTTTKTTKTIKGLTPGTTCVFTVRAFYRKGSQILQGRYSETGITVTVK